MSAPDNNRARVIAGLTALRAAPGTPPRAAAAAASLVDRLGAPVRVGIVGPPGSGKRRLLAALTGGGNYAGRDVPTLEVTHGPEARCSAMLADGGRVTLQGPLSDAVLHRAPVFVTIETPKPALVDRSYLLVMAGEDSQDAKAALAWAAGRIDICLWCSRHFAQAERALWQAAPDSLRNHAVLVHGGAAGADGMARQEGFDAAFSQSDPATGQDALLRHLAALTEEARAQDLDAARMVLQRHGGGAVEAQVVAHPARARPTNTRPDITGRGSTEAHSELTRLFLHLRREAENLAMGLSAPGADHGDAVLAGAEALFEALSDRVATLDHLQDAWPDLPGLLLDAHDLALLMRMEGGAGQAADAARLMVQVRREFETLLAA